jgi:hypothetical protein
MEDEQILIKSKKILHKQEGIDAHIKERKTWFIENGFGNEEEWEDYNRSFGTNYEDIWGEKEKFGPNWEVKIWYEVRQEWVKKRQQYMTKLFLDDDEVEGTSKRISKMKIWAEFEKSWSIEKKKRIDTKWNNLPNDIKEKKLEEVKNEIRRIGDMEEDITRMQQQIQHKEKDIKDTQNRLENIKKEKESLERELYVRKNNFKKVKEEYFLI